MTTFALDGMDLAALLCSRVCHDVISPVGAIINGLEVLEDEKDGEMREVALDLIKRSAPRLRLGASPILPARLWGGGIGRRFDRHRRRGKRHARPDQQ